MGHQKAPTNGFTQTLQSLGAPDMAPGTMSSTVFLPSSVNIGSSVIILIFQKAQWGGSVKAPATQSDIPEFPPQDAQREERTNSWGPQIICAP